MPAIGETVSYKAVAGDVYPAKVTKVHEDGFVDVDIIKPGETPGRGTLLMSRARVMFSADPGFKPRGICYPRE